MAVYTKQLIDDASTILHDTGTTRRWSTDDLLRYLNAGQVALVKLVPAANTNRFVYQLSAGAFQPLPDGSGNFVDVLSGESIPRSIALIQMHCNMGLDGATPGRIITPVQKSVFDTTNPSWPGATAAATVLHYMVSPDVKRGYFVYPPQPTESQGYVDAFLSTLPEACATYAVDTPISLDDEYADSLLYFILYRAYMIDTDEVDGAQRSVAFWNQFAESIGRFDLVQRQNTPTVGKQRMDALT